jgi:3-methyladenine DNA glycosylase AlkD
VSDAHRVAAAIERALRVHANAERQAFLSAGYAPSALRGYGVPVPALRAVVRQFARTLRDRPPRELLAIGQALTDRKVTEARQVGYELIARRRDAMALLTPAKVRRLGAGNDNWASVDGFATSVSGPAWRLGLVHDADVRRWATSADPWWRRTALASAVALNLASRGGQGDPPRTLAICAYFAAEQQPMLAKALSWALRSAVPHDPPAVRAFLTRHRDTLPKLVLREVTTKLDTGLKQRKSAARRK